MEPKQKIQHLHGKIERDLQTGDKLKKTKPNMKYGYSVPPQTAGTASMCLGSNSTSLWICTGVMNTIFPKDFFLSWCFVCYDGDWWWERCLTRRAPQIFHLGGGLLTVKLIAYMLHPFHLYKSGQWAMGEALWMRQSHLGRGDVPSEQKCFRNLIGQKNLLMICSFLLIFGYL